MPPHLLLLNLPFVPAQHLKYLCCEFWEGLFDQFTLGDGARLNYFAPDGMHKFPNS